MAAIITRVVFDERQFPIAPFEDNDAPPKKIDEGPAEDGFNPDYVDMLEPQYRPTHEDFENGEYTLFVGVEGDDRNPVVVFTLENNQTNVRSHVIGKVQLEAYLREFHNFHESFVPAAQQLMFECGMDDEESDEIDAALDEWRIDYLKTETFGDKLKGSDEFWDGFFCQLYTATAPLIATMIEAQNKEVSPTIEESPGAQYLQGPY